MFDFVDPIQAKKNLNRQGTKVLHSIVEAYNEGAFDDPKLTYGFGGLLASICEGKVQGRLDEETMKVMWSITPAYQKQLDELAAAAAKENIIIGPWAQYEDR
mgnify:FL=1|tara:strand:+ start:239 stop:544 length:306 start_codon:yes stop_codon:yes gene_type:complete